MRSEGGEEAEEQAKRIGELLDLVRDSRGPWQERAKAIRYDCHLACHPPWSEPGVSATWPTFDDHHDMWGTKYDLEKKSCCLQKTKQFLE